MDTTLPVPDHYPKPDDDDDDEEPAVAARIVTVDGEDIETFFIREMERLGARFVDATPDPDAPDGDEEEEESE